MAKIFFYNNKDSNHALPKNLIYLFESDISIIADNNLLSPKFVLRRIDDLIATNYAYVPTFGRYYYVTITTKENGMCLVECEIDVLQSYANEILSMECLIARQEKKYNNMLPDDQIKSRVGTVTEKKKIGSIGNTISYVLTVTGGVNDEPIDI